MNILIIYTYPNHQSFNDAILKVVQQNLSKDHNVNTLDLYEEQFDPILRFDDMHKRRDLKGPYRSFTGKILLDYHHT